MLGLLYVVAAFVFVVVNISSVFFSIFLRNSNIISKNTVEFRYYIVTKNKAEFRYYVVIIILMNLGKSKAMRD